MNIKIYQSFFKLEQFSKLEKSFIPYNNLENKNSALHEYPIILDLYSKNKNYDGYWGMMSWRFKEKSGITGEQFLKLIRDNPGYDVYHMNPFYEVTTKYSNPFTQGEVHHPGMINFINSLLGFMGYNLDITKENFDKENFIFCSYYVGNNRFWENWMAFQEIAMSIANNNDAMKTYMFNSYTINRDRRVINFPFMFERLVNLFLYLYKTEFRVKGFNETLLGNKNDI